MTDIITLSQRLNTRTLHFVLLSMATCGVWPLLWLYKKAGYHQRNYGLSVLRQFVCYMAHRLFRAQPPAGCYGSA
ncbi:hypothetical protein [Yersinia enterocolitica]|uniref:hypothetical protein n=1 Tax=Yersinia enterocolitica TaxID=630 RepID=UPI00384DF7C6